MKKPGIWSSESSDNPNLPQVLSFPRRRRRPMPCSSGVEHSVVPFETSISKVTTVVCSHHKYRYVYSLSVTSENSEPTFRYSRRDLLIYEKFFVEDLTITWDYLSPV